MRALRLALSAVWLSIERLWHDVRHGARVFAKNPGFTAIAVISIAFGTGANVAIFSITDAMLLRPLPIAHPSELLNVGFKTRIGTVYQSVVSYREYLDLRDRATTFEGLLAYDYWSVGIAPHAGVLPKVRYATFVSSNFFRVLGVEPTLGRGFLPDEEKLAGADPVVVLSDAAWRAEFDADPHILGRKLRVSGLEFTIVGVAPASFTGLHPYVRDSLFLPFSALSQVVHFPRPDALEARDYRPFNVKGRLRPGATMEDARTELTGIASQLEQAYPDTNRNVGILLQSEVEYKIERRPLDASLIVLLNILSIAVLCVACANVAGLLASRAPVRMREMALRLAIGASRARLVRQLITESLGIAIFGAAAGLLVGWVGILLLAQIQFPTDMVTPPAARLDERALMFSLIVAAACALLVGLGPALQTTRVDLATSLKSSDTSNIKRQRLTGRSVLVTVQVALSLVVLTVAVFAVQVFHFELTSGPGWRTTRMAKATIDPGQARYSDPDAVRFFASVLEQARALPGVRSASLTSAMPLFSFQFVPIAPEGYEFPNGQSAVPVWSNAIDERYFETMEIPLVSGRTFAPTDDAGAPLAAIVNETLARQYWPGQDPIGKRVRVHDRPVPPVVEIVGVVRTTRYGYPGELPQEAIYFPYRQRAPSRMVLLAQSTGDSTSLLDPLRDVVRRTDMDVPVYEVQTIETFYAARVTGIGNVMIRLIGGMGLMGMALTMVGLYGLVSYGVSRRTREIGIRIAIGATYARIVVMILRQGMTPAWYGLGAGLMLSVVTGRLLPRYIPFNHHIDLVTFYIVIPLVLVVTILAAFVPARRAAKIDPTQALRCD